MAFRWRSRSMVQRAGPAVANILTVLLLLVAAGRAWPAVAEMKARSETAALAAVADGKPTMLLLFQERDCSTAGAFVTDWRRLRAAGGVRVIAVPVNVRSRESLAGVMAEFPAGFDIRPELADVGGALLRQLRQAYTPAAVLLDGRGRPRLVIPGLEASMNQLEVQTAVTTYLSMLRSP